MRCRYRRPSDRPASEEDEEEVEGPEVVEWRSEDDVAGWLNKLAKETDDEGV